MSSKNLVSVIIPAYNAAAYVKEAVDSAIAQTYPNKEVIVVDDGSTDGTRAVLEPYIKKKAIVYLHQENRGLAGARNTGVRSARGEFVALLDSDDIFLPDKLERQVGYLVAHPNCGVCYCDLWHFYDDAPGHMLKLNYIYYSGDEVFPRLLKMNFINPLSVVVRRSEINRVGLFDETYRRSEDWEYWVRLAYHGVRFCFLPETLAKYRMHKGSLSYGWSVKAAEKETVLRIFKTLRDKMSREERRRYHMQKVVWGHTMKLWLTYVGDYFPPLQWWHAWRQKRRLG